MTFKTVPITAVKVGPLATDADHVKMLAESIEQLGGELINPITVNKQMVLIAGAHRYRAARLAGKTRIDVKIVDAVGHDAALIRLDENLGQKHRPALELAEMLRERKAAYELKHPDAPKRGGDRSKTKSVRSATASVAKETGRTERSVQQYVAVAEKLAPKAKKKLKGTEAANSITDLQRLAKLEPEHQVAVAERVAATGETVKQAAKALKREEQVEQARVYLPPPGEFEVITVDFPWEYDDELDGKGMERGLPYPSMSIEEICAFIDTKLSPAKDCALFCWVTNPILLDLRAWPVVQAKLEQRWGFVAKQVRTWVKTNDEGEQVTKQGWVWRGDTEHLVRLERGKPVFLPTGANHGNPIQRTSFRAPIGEHSEKPAAAYMDIEHICASTSRLEMFARAPRPGWVTTGSELADTPTAAPEVVRVSSEDLGDLTGTKFGEQLARAAEKAAKKRKLPPIVDVTEPA